MARRWPMTSLLDILKETDLRVGFPQLFRSPTAWENLDRDTLQYRLLLALYGLGTGAGLKRVGMGHNGVSYRDLLYIRRRFIPTATLPEPLLLTQGFMSPSKAVSLIAGDRKIVILRGQFWTTHSSVAVGLSPKSTYARPLRRLSMESSRRVYRRSGGKGPPRGRRIHGTSGRGTRIS
jgi:hypothetical protein